MNDDAPVGSAGYFAGSHKLGVPENLALPKCKIGILSSSIKLEIHNQIKISEAL